MIYLFAIIFFGLITFGFALASQKIEFEPQKPVITLAPKIKSKQDFFDLDPGDLFSSKSYDKLFNGTEQEKNILLDRWLDFLATKICTYAVMIGYDADSAMAIFAALVKERKLAKNINFINYTTSLNQDPESFFKDMEYTIKSEHFRQKHGLTLKKGKSCFDFADNFSYSQFLKNYQNFLKNALVVHQTLGSGGLLILILTLQELDKISNGHLDKNLSIKYTRKTLGYPEVNEEKTKNIVKQTLTKVNNDIFEQKLKKII